MMLKKHCPCEQDGICPYMYPDSGSFIDCEYWCGQEYEYDYSDLMEYEGDENNVEE